MQKPIATLMAVGLLVLAACGTGGEVEPGPITSFEDIAGTYEGVHEIQGLGQRIFFHFSEDGTITRSTNPDPVEDDQASISENRFEGTTMFLHQIKGICRINPDATYEIHLLENGNLRFVVIEDPCAERSSLDGSEFAPVP